MKTKFFPDLSLQLSFDKCYEAFNSFKLRQDLQFFLLLPPLIERERGIFRKREILIKALLVQLAIPPPVTDRVALCTGQQLHQIGYKCNFFKRLKKSVFVQDSNQKRKHSQGQETWKYRSITMLCPEISHMFVSSQSPMQPQRVPYQNVQQHIVPTTLLLPCHRLSSN